MLLSSCVPAARQALRSPEPEIASATTSNLTWLEHGYKIQANIEPSLALSVETLSISAVPVDPDIMFAESLPAAAQFRFLGYRGGQSFRLPYPFTEPRLNIYATRDFPGYGDDLPIGLPQSLERLRTLLAEVSELSMCERLPDGDAPPMPFLPWLNSAQVFCAHPKYLQFNGGQGIRYLTAFSQEAGSPTDDMIFYTFQGLSDDGEIYLSAVFPVHTGVFPAQPDPNFNMETWLEVLQSQFEQLHSAEEQDFSPDLAELDQMVQDLSVEKPE